MDEIQELRKTIEDCRLVNKHQAGQIDALQDFIQRLAGLLKAVLDTSDPKDIPPDLRIHADIYARSVLNGGDLTAPEPVDTPQAGDFSGTSGG